MNENSKGGFTGKIGFVLAAAGSAVGLGNLWRFPYLAAKDGGGIFLIVYIVLALTFGFALMLTEIAIGRKTRKSPIEAYGAINKRFSFLGIPAAVVPLILFPYYCVIGGWVCKYSFDYITGRGINTVADGYFTDFITSLWQSGMWCAVFLGASAVVVFLGVEKGIEKFSKLLMPVLSLMVVGIALYALTLSDPVSGRNAVEGLKIYIIPNFDGMSIRKFFGILLDAMGQVFFSMSLAMGVMITYGSYTKKETNLVEAVSRIEIFDTVIAVFAGLIMIPAVYTFQGTDGLDTAGPSLLFISLPRVFAQMGNAGHVMGALFFLLVLFAALTSSVSIMEAVVSVIMDKFKLGRNRAVLYSLIFSSILAAATCFGYNVWYFEYTLPNGTKGQLLDIFDYLINSLLMPAVALLTCVMVGWFGKMKDMTEEIKANGENFGREGLYTAMVRYIAPVFLTLILLSSFGIFNFII